MKNKMQIILKLTEELADDNNAKIRVDAEYYGLSITEYGNISIDKKYSLYQQHINYLVHNKPLTNNEKVYLLLTIKHYNQNQIDFIFKKMVDFKYKTNYSEENIDR